MATAITLKDIIFLIIIIFQSGLTIGIVFSNLKSAVKTIDELKIEIGKMWATVDANGKAIAKIEGRLNNKK